MALVLRHSFRWKLSNVRDVSMSIMIRRSYRFAIPLRDGNGIYLHRIHTHHTLRSLCDIMLIFRALSNRNRISFGLLIQAFSFIWMRALARSRARRTIKFIAPRRWCTYYRFSLLVPILCALRPRVRSDAARRKAYFLLRIICLRFCLAINPLLLWAVCAGRCLFVFLLISISCTVSFSNSVRLFCLSNARRSITQTISPLLVIRRPVRGLHNEPVNLLRSFEHKSAFRLSCICFLFASII